MINNFIFSKKGAVAVFALTALAFTLRPFFIGIEWVPFDFHEHFYNTLSIIDNLRLYGIPVFDSVDVTAANATTDFSPVYASLLYLLTAVIPSSSVFFFVVLRFLIVLCGIASFFLLNDLVKKLHFSQTSSGEIFFINALFLTLFARDAMTATGSFLVIPAILATARAAYVTLNTPTVARGACLGLWMSLCLLIQLDSFGFLLTLTLVFYFQFNGKTPVTYKGFLKLISGLLIGLVPLAAFITLLYVKQRLLLPSSYVTWQSVQEHRPWNLFLLIFWYPLRYFLRMPTQLILMTIPATMCLLAAGASFPKEAKNQTARDTVFLSLVWYPILWLVILAFLTYVDLPPYAFYALAVGSPFSLMFVIEKIRDNQRDLEHEKILLNKYCLLMGALCVLMTFLQIATPYSRAYKPLAQATVDAMTETPAVYAMGKGAGIALYFKKMPLIRIDGYAASETKAALVRTSASLADVLKQCGADFYITVNAKKTNGCITAREPSNTLFGATNRAMSAWICAPPVVEKKLSNGLLFSVFKTSDVQTAVK